MNSELFPLIEKFRHLSFIVIGDAMLDVYIKGFSDRLCREAPVPIVAVDERKEFAGGAANTAVNITSLGAYCYFISALGYDSEAQHLQNLLSRQQVDIRNVLHEERVTLTKQRVFSQNQQLVRFDLGRYQEITQKTEDAIVQALHLLYSHCNGIIISDYGYGVLTKKIISTIQVLQNKFKKILIVDAKQPQKYHMLKPTLVKPNFQETIQLLELKDYPKENRISFIHPYRETILQKTGAKIAAVTVDNEGSIIFQVSSDSFFHTPTTPVDNTQAAGAGDTYTAMFSLALATDASIFQAAQLAATAAEIVVKKDLTAACNKLDVYHHYFSQEKQISNIYITSFIDVLKRNNKRVVFTNGCFDILHSGHINYLTQAKKLGDILIIGVNTDESVKRLKGEERPINSLTDRLKVLAGLESVDYVIPFGEDTPISLIKEIRPDIYVKGGDYTRETLPEVPVVESLGGRIEIIPYVKDHSTTLIIESIRKSKNQHIKYYSYE